MFLASACRDRFIEKSEEWPSRLGISNSQLCCPWGVKDILLTGVWCKLISRVNRLRWNCYQLDMKKKQTIFLHDCSDLNLWLLKLYCEHRRFFILKIRAKEKPSDLMWYPGSLVHGHTGKIPRHLWLEIEVLDFKSSTTITVNCIMALYFLYSLGGPEQYWSPW